METLSLTEATRLNLQKLDTTPGLPPLPHIPQNLDVKLTLEQQEANLLHVALWIVEHDQQNFSMDSWHWQWSQEVSCGLDPRMIGKKALLECGTVHCIAGFAQVMAGVVGFSDVPVIAGLQLLGGDAYDHFHDEQEEGLEFLNEVIARNS